MKENRPIALVTGASRGIGRATAWSLAQRGFDLVLVSRSAESLTALATEIEDAHRTRVLPFAADLTDNRDLARLVYAIEHSPRIDVLVNNAGIRGRSVAFSDYTDDEIDTVLNLNLRAPALLCRSAARVMARQGDGHILNVLSSACLHPYESFAAYTAAKRGLEGLTRVLMKELRTQGVRVTALIPGGTDSKTPSDQETRYLRPHDVGEAIAAIVVSRQAVLQEVVLRTLGDERI